jgi:hypothetical protein
MAFLPVDGNGSGYAVLTFSQHCRYPLCYQTPFLVSLSLSNSLGNLNLRLFDRFTKYDLIILQFGQNSTLLSNVNRL